MNYIFTHCLWQVSTLISIAPPPMYKTHAGLYLFPLRSSHFQMHTPVYIFCVSVSDTYPCLCFFASLFQMTTLVYMYFFFRCLPLFVCILSLFQIHISVYIYFSSVSDAYPCLYLIFNISLFQMPISVYFHFFFLSDTYPCLHVFLFQVPTPVYIYHFSISDTYFSLSDAYPCFTCIFVSGAHPCLFYYFYVSDAYPCLHVFLFQVLTSAYIYFFSGLNALDFFVSDV